MSNKRPCYRHRSCKKQVNGFTMDLLQNEIDGLPDKDREIASRVWSLFSSSSGRSRNVILSGLLVQCCSSQLSHISSQLRELGSIDFISNLPSEIVFNILRNLDALSLCRAAQVCKLWQEYADDDVLWNRLCEQHIDKRCTECGWGIPSLVEEKKRDSIFSWKSVYAERCIVGKNWNNCKYSVKELTGHTDGVLCMQIKGHLLISGSYDTTICVWDLNTGKRVRILTGHSRPVRTIMFDDHKLISGSMDNTVRIWDYHTGTCISTLQGHTDSIIGLHYDDSWLVTGSSDNTVGVWNFETKNRFFLRGHTDWVNSVFVDTSSMTIYSASDDSTVRMWDIEKKSCIRIFQGHVGPVQKLIPLAWHSECKESSEHSHLLTAALDNTIKLWDIATGTCIKTLFGHVEGIWALCANNLRIVSGSHDHSIKIWDLENSKCEHTITAHDSPVLCVDMSDSMIVSGAEDGVIKALCFI